MPYDFRIAVASGLEPAAEIELRLLGHEATTVAKGMLRLSTSLEQGARLALTLRSATRVVLETASRLPLQRDDLFEAIAALPWEEHFANPTTWAVRAGGRSDALRHTTFAARFVKDAVRLRFERLGRQAPPVNPQDPQVLLDLRLGPDSASVGIDLGGKSLHRRGNARRGEAPLREDLAAGLALLAGVRPLRAGGTPCNLLDPFCGSGTLIGEATCLQMGIAPRRNPREMSLGHLLSFADIRLSALCPAPPSPDSLPASWRLAADENPHAVATLERLCRRLGIEGAISARSVSLQGLEPPASAAGIMLTNPPWGRRMKPAALEHLWFEIGRMARTHLKGWRIAVLCGDKALSRHLHLRAERRWPVHVGGIDTRWLLYEIR